MMCTKQEYVLLGVRAQCESQHVDSYALAARTLLHETWRTW